jgi:hypothetical protein
MSEQNSEIRLTNMAEENIDQLLDPRRSTSPAENPYDKKPSYKDILLSKVTDDSNRMGINTFQLIHLLNS